MTASLIVPDWPAPARVRAVATTRLGGVSGAPYASLNLGDHVGDDAAAVAANRALLRTLVPDLPDDPAWLRQVHGTRCVDLARAGAHVEADAAISRLSGTVCAILTADCLPVLLCDMEGSVVGAAHCGWRGLAGGVVARTVKAMHVPAAGLMAWLGPAIGPRAFEVGDEVREAFVARDPGAAQAFAAHRPGKWMCDLYRLARLQLAALGVNRVFGGGSCTFEDSARFYSYRRDGTTGRMATLIWLASESS